MYIDKVKLSMVGGWGDPPQEKIKPKGDYLGEKKKKKNNLLVHILIPDWNLCCVITNRYK